MRNGYLGLVILLFVWPLHGQEMTLIDTSSDSGFYGGTVLQIGMINDRPAVFTGKRLGWLVNDRLAVGGGYYRVRSDNTLNNTLADDLRYAGVEMEYIGSHSTIIHYTVSGLAGGGLLSFEGEAEASDWVQNHEIFLVLRPGVTLEINVTQNIRAGMGFEYLQPYGVDRYGLESDDFTGPQVMLFLKAGKF